MKIAYTSDLHLEHQEFDFELPDADVIFLCGDITVSCLLKNAKHIKFFEACSKKYDKVFYVLGNHEHYTEDLYHTKLKIEYLLKSLSNVKVLENEFVELDENNILFGGTMWTDFNNNELYKSLAQFSISDYRYIINSVEKRYLKPDDTVSIFKQFIESLSKTYDEFHDKNIIVMSHHAPSFGSSHPRYLGDPLSYAFCSHLENFILQRPRIKYWFHGHVHYRTSYTIGESTTMILTNPRGYPTEIFEDFSVKVVEI